MSHHFYLPIYLLLCTMHYVSILLDKSPSESMWSNEKIYSIFRLTGNCYVCFSQRIHSQIETVDVWPSPRSIKKNGGVGAHGFCVDWIHRVCDLYGKTWDLNYFEQIKSCGSARCSSTSSSSFFSCIFWMILKRWFHFEW